MTMISPSALKSPDAPLRTIAAGSRGTPTIAAWRTAGVRTVANLQAALRLAEAGVAVFPASVTPKPDGSGGWNKRPFVNWRSDERASADPDVIRQWWTRFPQALPGIDCEAAGLVVIDGDRHGGPDGIAALEALQVGHGRFPDAPATDTAGGGVHLYFRQPSGLSPLGNAEGRLSGKGINVRGAGGWVVAPGAIRSDGKEWSRSEGAPDLVEALQAGEVPEVPAFIVEAIRPSQRPEPRPMAAQESRRQLSPKGATDRGRERASALRALADETAAVASAPDGSRNNTLNLAAFNLGQMVGAGWIDRADVEEALTEAARVAGLDPVETRRTLASGLGKGIASPRAPLQDRARPGEAGELAPIGMINGMTAEHAAVHALPPLGSRERGRIVDLSRDEEFAPPEEVIRDTIPAQGVGFLGGQSGAYKTFCAIELAFCLMTGDAFAGRPVERMGGVIYCAFEGAGTISGRVKARRSRLADPGQELPFLMLEGFGAIQSPADFAAFRKRVSDLAALMLDRWGAPLGAIVIDTVAASGMIPEDKENDPGAWQRVFDGLNPLSREHDAPVILIHHYGKSADAGLRGSSNARAGADFVLALTCDRDEITGDSSGHYLALTKSRTAPEGGIASIAAEAVEIGHRKDGSAVTSLVLTFDVATKLVTAKARKPGRAEIAFGEALTEALGEHGDLQHIMGDASAMAMKAVPLDKLKDQFGRRYVTGEGDERKKADTIRKQFKSALDKAVAARRCAVGTWGGVEWAWML